MNAKEMIDRLLAFSVRIGKVVDALPETRMGRHVASQLVRAGTAGLPNYEEACGAESPRDFVHKLRICLKELRESRSWLRLILGAELLPEKRLSGLVDESDQLCRIIGRFLVTAKGLRVRRRQRSKEEPAGRQ